MKFEISPDKKPREIIDRPIRTPSADFYTTPVPSMLVTVSRSWILRWRKRFSQGFAMNLGTLWSRTAKPIRA